MEKSTTSRLAVAGGLRRMRMPPTPRPTTEVNDEFPFLAAGNFNVGRKFHKILAQRLWHHSKLRILGRPLKQKVDGGESVMGRPRVQPTGGQVSLHGRGWERYLGRPIRQTNGTCVLVACIGCLEAVHRFEYEKVHGEGTFFIPRTRRADEPLQKLFDECRADGTWVKGWGASVDKVLHKIQAMGRVLLAAANAPTPAAAACILPLREWRRHSWDDYCGTGLSSGRVAALLDGHGPCVGLLWVCPPYFDLDAGRNDAAVYRGCGRANHARIHSKHLYGDKAGFHAVVCFAYRFRGEQQMDVLVMDNHDDATGPQRWVDVEELDALYTLDVEGLPAHPPHTSTSCYQPK